MEYDAANLKSHFGEKQSSSSRARGDGTAKPGMWGRTDQALVRKILGADRVAKLPPKTKIYWDGKAQRCYASASGGNIRRTNASTLTGRFLLPASLPALSGH